MVDKIFWVALGHPRSPLTYVSAGTFKVIGFIKRNTKFFTSLLTSSTVLRTYPMSSRVWYNSMTSLKKTLHIHWSVSKVRFSAFSAQRIHSRKCACLIIITISCITYLKFFTYFTKNNFLSELIKDTKSFRLSCTFIVRSTHICIAKPNSVLHSILFHNLIIAQNKGCFALLIIFSN